MRKMQERYSKCNVNIQELSKKLNEFLDEKLEGLISDIEGTEAVPTTDFKELFKEQQYMFKALAGLRSLALMFW